LESGLLPWLEKKLKKKVIRTERRPSPLSANIPPERKKTTVVVRAGLNRSMSLAPGGTAKQQFATLGGADPKTGRNGLTTTERGEKRC
jgi:hypothetical protein